MFLDDCVVCGEHISGHDHHCNPRVEARIEAARKGHSELLGDRAPSFSERLTNGFWLLDLCEN